MSKNNEFTREQADLFVYNMLDAGSSFNEIKQYLSEKDIDTQTAEGIIRPFYINKLQKKLKRNLIIISVLALLMIILYSLYLYGESLNQQLAIKNAAEGLIFKQEGDEIYVMGYYSNYKFLLRLIFWLGLAAAWRGLVGLYLFFELKKVKRTS